MVIKKNTKWSGKKAGLTSIAFKIITDTDTEIQAMRGGEVDAITRSPESALSTLVHRKNPSAALSRASRRSTGHPGGPAGARIRNLKKQYVRGAIAWA